MIRRLLGRARACVCVCDLLLVRSRLLTICLPLEMEMELEWEFALVAGVELAREGGSPVADSLVRRAARSCVIISCVLVI